MRQNGDASEDPFQTKPSPLRLLVQDNGARAILPLLAPRLLVTSREPAYWVALDDSSQIDRLPRFFTISDNLARYLGAALVFRY